MLTVAPVWGNTRKHIGCVSPRSRARQAEADETMLRLRAASQQAYHHNRMLQFFALRQPVPQYMRLTRHNLGNHFYQVDEMFRLDTALHLSPLLLPTKYRTSARDSVNCVEGLCIVLRRLSFPSRWKDLVPIFGRSKASVSHLHTYNAADT